MTERRNGARLARNGEKPDRLPQAGGNAQKKTISEGQMNLKKTLIGLGVTACLITSLSAQNKTSKETKMGKSLVVYFSLAGDQYNVGIIKEGNTSIIAKFISEETGSELFEIETVKPYPTDSYNNLIKIAKDEQNKKARPALKADIDITAYDTIYIGYPNWWGDMPMPVYTFLEAHNWSGKTIIPFCTHEGSGLSGTESRIRSTCKGATVEKGLAVQGKIAQTNRNAAKKAVQDWLAKLGK